MDMVPVEWIEKYGALFDKATDSSRPIVTGSEDGKDGSSGSIKKNKKSLYWHQQESAEKRKIEKDINRTFSVFSSAAATKRTVGLSYIMNEDRYQQSLARLLLAATAERGYVMRIRGYIDTFMFRAMAVDYSILLLH